MKALKTEKKDRAVQPEGEPQVAASVPGYVAGHPLLHLQRSIGNRAVNRLLQTKTKPGEADAVQEREMNGSALRVARAPHLSAISGARVQREERPKESVGALDSSVSNAIGSTVLGETEWKFIREGLRGVVEEVRHQPPERFQLIQTRFAQFSQSPTAQWEYYKGLLSGIGEGLWDSVKGIFDLLTLGPRLQIQAMEWLLNNGPNFINNFEKYRAEAEGLRESLNEVLGQAYKSSEKFLSNPGEGLMAVRAILDQLMVSALDKARSAGHKVAASTFEFLELPWKEFGEKVGYVYGMVLFEALLAVATEGIANGLKAVGSLLSKGGRVVAAEALRLFRLLEETAGSLWAALKSMGRVALEIFKDLAEALGVLFKRAESFFKRIVEGMEAAAEAALPEPALAGGGRGMRVPENALMSEATEAGARGVRTTPTTVAELKPPPQSPPVKRLPPGPEPPPQYTRPSERPGRESDLESLLGESQETSAVQEVGTTGAGMARLPRHHVFPQEYRSFFKSRGFEDIDNFCVELEESAHQAIHGGGDYKLGRTWSGEWNKTIMRLLRSEEEKLGRKLVKDEIIDLGKKLMRKYKINRRFVPFER
jgi:hypothetical protein